MQPKNHRDAKNTGKRILSLYYNSPICSQAAEIFNVTPLFLFLFLFLILDGACFRSPFGCGSAALWILRLWLSVFWKPDSSRQGVQPGLVTRVNYAEYRRR